MPRSLADGADAGGYARDRLCSSSSSVGGSNGDAGSRVETLSLGVRAVVETMDGEVKFTNDNERAFALFRKGCRHCAELHTALEDVEPKDTIIAFLARIAGRRSAARQVRELGAILVQVAAWRDELLVAPQQLLEVLNSDDSILAAFAAAGQGRCTGGPAPPHEGRVFLREAWTARFLSIAEHIERERVVHRCVMTEKPASLFVCYETEEVEEDEVDFRFSPEARCGGTVDGMILGFAHEGLPALGHFLGCQRPRRRTLRDALSGGGTPELGCASRDLGGKEQFRWWNDGSVQHVASSFWLFVDPESPDAITLHQWDKSFWEAVLAV